MVNQKYIDIPRRICTCFFSPCGNVKTIVNALGQALADQLHIELAEYDFTLPRGRQQNLNFSKEDVVIIGTPVYASRVPNKIMPFIRDCIHGDQTRAILVVSYGNRSYGDALSELKLLSVNNGFVPMAAAALASEHSFAEELATGHLH